MPRGETRVAIGDRELTVSNLDKVLFPDSGFTKGQLLDYYVKAAGVMLPHIEDRPVTLKRYPDGVDEDSFYAKRVPPGAPPWVRTVTVPTSEAGDDIEYMVVGDLATLAWAANLGSIEFHVPLWRVGEQRKLPAPPDQIVFDLDPGEGTTIVECCQVAILIADVLKDQGRESRAKTSGSKGLQVYAELTGASAWDRSRAEARGIAELLEHDHGELVTSNMRKALRRGKILIDWSQNHRSKTTIAVYSVRGRSQPTVSTPVTWSEVRECVTKGDPVTMEFTTADVLDRIEKSGDLFGYEESDVPQGRQDSALRAYRAKRDPSKTPEPMGHEHSPGDGESPRFVVQEHHARSLHWDFRLEHDGVFVSWALPKGVPEDPQTNHLAVRTEDHPLSYGSFEGEIPRGEYGAGTVRIWDSGTFDVEKWRPDEVMVRLRGSRTTGRYVLFPTGGKNWMIHRMDPARPDFSPLPKRVAPMLATLGALPKDDTGWAYEIKWDGVRAIAFIDGGRVRLQSRNGNDITEMFPEFRQIGEFVGPRPCILDGEIVVMGQDGKPDFGRLQHRLQLSDAHAIRKRSTESPANYVIFDLLHLDGRPTMELSYDERRAALESLHLSGDSYTTADAYRDIPGVEVLKATREAGLEGVVAKRRDATYRQGKRSSEWIKVKNERTQEVVVGGWTEGAGNRARSIGALLVGLPEHGGLRFVGKVGTGFSAQDREHLLGLLERSETKKSPFLPATEIDEKVAHHFVRPKLVGEVRFSDWTSAGRLRHPVWRGIRGDKRAADVTAES